MEAHAQNWTTAFSAAVYQDIAVENVKVNSK